MKADCPLPSYLLTGTSVKPIPSCIIIGKVVFKEWLSLVSQIVFPLVPKLYQCVTERDKEMQ